MHAKFDTTISNEIAKYAFHEYKPYEPCPKALVQIHNIFQRKDVIGLDLKVWLRFKAFQKVQALGYYECLNVFLIF